MVPEPPKRSRTQTSFTLAVEETAYSSAYVRRSGQEGNRSAVRTRFSFTNSISMCSSSHRLVGHDRTQPEPPHASTHDRTCRSGQERAYRCLSNSPPSSTSPIPIPIASKSTRVIECAALNRLTVGHTCRSWTSRLEIECQTEQLRLVVEAADGSMTVKTQVSET
jgi:hypothetical protein